MSKTATYSLIASQTLGSAQTTVTFSSIPGTYTDLRIIVNAKYTNGISAYTELTFNSDSTTNYSNTGLYGNGTSALSYRDTNKNAFNIMYTGNATNWFNSIIDIFDYSNTTTYKTCLVRDNRVEERVEERVGLWRKTPEAINTIKFYNQFGNFLTDSSFRLYGIQAGSN
jgi:hypothetical protein